MMQQVDSRSIPAQSQSQSQPLPPSPNSFAHHSAPLKQAPEDVHLQKEWAELDMWMNRVDTLQRTLKSGEASPGGVTFLSNSRENVARGSSKPTGPPQSGNSRQITPADSSNSLYGTANRKSLQQEYQEIDNQMRQLEALRNNLRQEVAAGAAGYTSPASKATAAPPTNTVPRRPPTRRPAPPPPALPPPFRNYSNVKANVNHNTNHGLEGNEVAAPSLPLTNYTENREQQQQVERKEEEENNDDASDNETSNGTHRYDNTSSFQSSTLKLRSCSQSSSGEGIARSPSAWSASTNEFGTFKCRAGRASARTNGKSVSCDSNEETAALKGSIFQQEKHQQDSVERETVAMTANISTHVGSRSLSSVRRKSRKSIANSCPKSALRIYHPDKSTKMVLIDDKTEARHIVDILIGKNFLKPSVKQTLVEKIPEYKIERCFEDHDKLQDFIHSGGSGEVGSIEAGRINDSKSYVFFEEREDKYGMFTNSKMWLGDNFSNKQTQSGLGEIDPEYAKVLFGGASIRLPQYKGHLFIKLPGSNQWKRRYCVVRNTGLFYAKNKKRVKEIQPTDLYELISFSEHFRLYTSTGGWIADKAPTPFGLALKNSIANDPNQMLLLCTCSEASFRFWYSVLRIAVIGRRIYHNYKIRKNMIQSWMGTSNNLSIEHAAIGNIDCGSVYTSTGNIDSVESPFSSLMNSRESLGCVSSRRDVQVINSNSLSDLTSLKNRSVKSEAFEDRQNNDDEPCKRPSSQANC